MENDFEKILNTANSFFRSAERCEEQRPISSNTFEMLLVPAATNRAFSIELYLKAILLKERRPTRGHRLHKLFNQLETATKQNIVSLCNLNNNEVNLKLQEITNLFIEWRYIFETESASLNIDFLISFSAATKQVAHMQKSNNA